MAEELSPEHFVALLKKQKSQLRGALVHKGEKPPASMRRSRVDLEHEFAMAAMKAAMIGRSRQANIATSFIGMAYPPCTLPLSSLTPMLLRDLRLETQHRGRVLVVRAYATPRKLTSIQNAVEDELGDVERLAIYNLLPAVTADEALGRGKVVAIKEPYFKRTADGGLFIRVDHPTDVVALKPGDSIIPRVLARYTTNNSTSPPNTRLLKEQGNSYFVSLDFERAANLYSEAIDACVPGDDGRLWRDLHRNRAAANLRLGRYELAIADALLSLDLSETGTEAARSENTKALYRAGKAAYEMQDFAQAKQHFEHALELDGDHAEARTELGRVEKRIAEQDTGDYDFTSMARSATLQHTRLDHATFSKRTAISMAEGNRGRGLFATQALSPGELVLVEKGFHTAHRDGQDIAATINVNTDCVTLGSQSLCLAGIIDKMIWNPTLAKRYLDLSAGGKGSDDGPRECKVVDGKVAVDTFLVQAIAEVNGFGCPRVKSATYMEASAARNPDHEQSTGIWLRAAYANHSCIPNANRAFIGDMMIVRAVRDIPAGGEILMGYADPTTPLAERQKKLRGNYGFDCDCELCRAEARVPAAVTKKRTRLWEEIMSFLGPNRTPAIIDLDGRPPAAAPSARAKRLLKEIRATYSKPVELEHLPRLGCDEVGLWVARSTMGHQPPQNSLNSFLGVLRDAGYFVTLQGGGALVDRSRAVTGWAAVHAAMYSAQCLRAIGNGTAAVALEALGKQVFVSITGSDDGFAQAFGVAQREVKV